MTEKKAERRAQIEAAAFEVLEEVGFKKASMLQIARRAKASNETLYSWYGNKQALFSSLIAANAQIVSDTLAEALDTKTSQDQALYKIGILLLHFTATEKAIIINRAAVADVQETGLLAQSIESHARQAMYSLLNKLMAQLEASSLYCFDNETHVATQVFVDLLIGELQMQQSLGSIAPLTHCEIEQRAQRACGLFDRLYRRGDQIGNSQ